MASDKHHLPRLNLHIEVTKRLVTRGIAFADVMKKDHESVVSTALGPIPLSVESRMQISSVASQETRSCSELMYASENGPPRGHGSIVSGERLVLFDELDREIWAFWGSAAAITSDRAASHHRFVTRARFNSERADTHQMRLQTRTQYN